MSDEKEGKEAEGKASESSSGEEEDFHVFVMEDTDFDLECVTMMIEESGFECTGFSEWKAAVTALEHPDCPADLVLCDYNQPDFDTLDFLRQMKEKGMAVVMMSGDSDKETIDSLLEGGLAKSFMVKPITFEDVTALSRFADDDEE